MGPGPSANGPLWSDVEEHDEAGLYRFKVYGHPEYRWISGGGASYEVDFALGAYLGCLAVALTCWSGHAMAGPEYFGAPTMVRHRCRPSTLGRQPCARGWRPRGMAGG